jgi:predicted DNA-binding protein (UPF0278 family)
MLKMMQIKIKRKQIKKQFIKFKVKKQRMMNKNILDISPDLSLLVICGN